MSTFFGGATEELVLLFDLCAQNLVGYWHLLYYALYLGMMQALEVKGFCIGSISIDFSVLAFPNWHSLSIMSDLLLGEKWRWLATAFQ